MASSSSTSSSSSSRIVIETAGLVLLRATFFVLAQQYLARSLYTDLRQVIRDETVPPHQASLGGFDNSDNDLPVSPAGDGPPHSSLRDQVYNLRSASNSSKSLLPTSRSIPTSPTERRRSPKGGINGSGTGMNGETRTGGQAKSSSAIAPRLSSAVFCISVSECVTLFFLILFGKVVGDSARLLNWKLSLGAVLALIVLVVPFGMCLLFSLRTKVTSVSFRRMATFTAIPFSVWLLSLFTIGDWIGTALGVETREQWTFGILSITLDRICVPGTVLIAALSGGAAVNSAWEAFEWRERSKSTDVVTEGHINAAMRSLAQTRTELQARMAEMEALASASMDGQPNSFFGRMFGQSPHAGKIKSLEGEIAGLEALDSQMSNDLQLMRRRKEISEMGKTWSGKIRQAMGWMFSLYCVYRIIMSLINLVFGTFSSSDRRTQPTDLASAVLGKLADAFGWNIDIATWSKVVGLVLIGGIIFANLNFVLSRVSRVFRATSAGNSASFMLLFLSQLMAVYLITSLISLPSVDATDKENASSPLLATLPDFRIFQRLFDGFFLFSATAVFAVRWLQRKIRVDEHLGLQDFV
ncbi:MAG: hypothetical protein CYPHOPRED_002285 [Cyphobasidiales sp. Tagirdzhanova-0007]|nr:MAG: hypothetical protein CYPHOPRED_002285 [Cyphobasidiales sp. Tagirdzhanova-0007]